MAELSTTDLLTMAAVASSDDLRAGLLLAAAMGTTSSESSADGSDLSQEASSTKVADVDEPSENLSTDFVDNHPVPEPVTREDSNEQLNEKLVKGNKQSGVPNQLEEKVNAANLEEVKMEKDVIQKDGKTAEKLLYEEELREEDTTLVMATEGLEEDDAYEAMDASKAEEMSEKSADDFEQELREQLQRFEEEVMSNSTNEEEMKRKEDVENELERIGRDVMVISAENGEEAETKDEQEKDAVAMETDMDGTEKVAEEQLKEKKELDEIEDEDEEYSEDEYEVSSDDAQDAPEGAPPEEAPPEDGPEGTPTEDAPPVLEPESASPVTSKSAPMTSQEALMTSQMKDDDQDKVVTPSGKTMREILMENAALKTKLANLMRDMDQRFRVTDELLQLTMIQRDKLNQLPGDDCRVVKIWNQKRREHAEVYLSPEARHMLKSGMSIVLRKKSMPNPVTVNRDVSDVDSDVGDVIASTSTKKSRRGRPLPKRRQNKQESESESEKEVKVKEVMKKKPTKTNWNKINAESKAKAEKKALEEKRSLEAKRKRMEVARNMKAAKEATTKKMLEKQKKWELTRKKPEAVEMKQEVEKKRPGRKKKIVVEKEESSMNESGSESESEGVDSESSMPKKRRGFRAKRGKITKNLTNSKTAILPKIRSARIRARATVKAMTASLRAESPVVKLSKDDIDNIDNYEKVEAKKKRGRPSEKKKEEETNEEGVRKLKELKRPERPVVPPTPTPVSAKEAEKVVVGCSKRKTFTPIRKNVEKKDYISEIKELTQKKTKIEPSDIGDVLPEIKPKRPESSVLNIPLSPSKMKLLQARDALKRKLGSEDERSPERKRGKTESVQPGSARTRGRTLVSEMKTKYAETDFIEKLKELDSQNRPKAKPVPDNETSAKLSRLIDSVAGRISSPVSFSESETKEDSNSDEIPAPVEEQRTDTESPPVVPVVMHTDPTSGEPLVGPMIPLAATQIKKPQILRIEATPAPCASTTSTSILPEKDGKMASVQIRTENMEAKTQTQNVVLVRDPKDPNRTMLVRIGPKPVGSAASNVQTAQMSPGGHIRISRPGLQPATISFSKQQQNPQSSSNIRMITLSQSEMGKSNLTGLLRSNPNILVSKTQGQRLVSPRVVQAPKVIYTVPKETSDSFLVGAAPTVPEPEMKKRTRPIDVSDLSTVKVHKKDDFKDQSYDSVQDLLNLMDDGSDVVQVRKASFSGDDERKEGKTVLVDSDLAVNAAQALVAMETTESGSTGEKSATVAMETGESSIPAAEEGSVDNAVFQNTGRSDLLWQLVKATIGDHFDGSEESMKSNDAISDEVPSENACQVTSGAISEDAHPDTSSQSEIPTQGVAEFGKLDENQSVKAVEQTLTTTSSTEQNVCEQIVQNMLENITVERAEMETSEIVMIEESKEKNQESTTENTKYERFESQESGLGLSPPDEKEIGDQNQLNCDKTVSDIDMESVAGSIGEAPEIQNPESDLEESPDVLNSDVEDEAKSIISESKTNDDATKSESLASKEMEKEMSEDGGKIENVEVASNEDSKVMEKWTDELLDELEKELEEGKDTFEEKAEVVGIKQEVLTEEENEEVLEDEQVDEENEEDFLEETSGNKDIVKKEPVEVVKEIADDGNDELIREMEELGENGQVESRSVSPAEIAEETENTMNNNETKENLDLSADIAYEDSDVESPIENLFPDSDSDDSIGGECVEEEPEDKTTKEAKVARKKPGRKTSISLEDISPRKAIFAPVRRQNRGTRKSQEKKEEEEKKTKRVLKINKSKSRGLAKRQRSISEDKDTPKPGDSSLRPSNPDLTMSTHQVIAIIRQGRDHYSRCPRQLEVSFDHPDYQQYYSDFMAKFKNTHHLSSPGGHPRKKHQQHDSGGKRRSSECHNVLLSGDLTSP